MPEPAPNPNLEYELLKATRLMIEEFQAKPPPNRNQTAAALTVCCLLAEATHPTRPIPEAAAQAARLANAVAYSCGWIRPDLNLEDLTR